MSRFTIIDVSTKELQVDTKELKEIFFDEWGWNVADGLGDEEFIRTLVDEYGIDGIEESLPDGPFSRVDGDLSIISDD